MIWFTSDFHFCHNKPFLYEPRGFTTVAEMNEAIVRNYNDVVHPNDEVYVLGDIMLNNNEEGARLLKSLKGNIHIILGNHDTDNRQELYNTCWNVVEVCHATTLKFEGYHFYLSHYPALTSNWDLDKPLKARLISLCGHSHTKDPFLHWPQGCIYHVELDAHHNYPVDIHQILDNILEKMSNENLTI